METYQKSRTNLLRVIERTQATYEKAYEENNSNEKGTKFIRMFKKNCQEAAEIAFQYTKILDPMVESAPSFAALAYGAVKILLYAHVNSQELKENILKYMDRIKSTFDMVEHLTVYIPSANLVSAMTQLYGLFHRFLAKAIRMYTRNRLSMSQTRTTALILTHTDCCRNVSQWFRKTMAEIGEHCRFNRVYLLKS